jgi:nucleoid DNA-binding protein
MDELVKLVSKKTGLSEAQSKQAVETVIGYLKSKLPAPVASQIDGVLSGKSQVADVAKGLGGLLKKK